MTTWDRRRVPREPVVQEALDRLERCWRVRGPNGHRFDCSIYSTVAGLEIRADYGEVDRVLSRRIMDIQRGRDIAAEWLLRLLNDGSFEALPPEPD